ncbi:permease [Sulfolobus acidocaldarius SUSAZ]|nr:permease [Sulfolobus acidocaldarius SUSAZ]
MIPYIELPLTLIQYILVIISGFIIGLILGLIGGGGSILAVPLLLYFVGLGNDSSSFGNYSNMTHLVLGTSALAVGLNAYINSFIHWRKGNVRVFEGVVFSVPGVIGSILGAYFGYLTTGSLILIVFGTVMIFIGLRMIKSKCKENLNETKGSGDSSVVRSKYRINIRIIYTGFLVGLASGFLGIGGGFLIVPALLFSTSMSIISAIGTSLISVGTFGVSTALTYASYGEVDYILSLILLVGGVGGGYIGTLLASKSPRSTLRKVFGVVLIVVAIYIIYRNLLL